MPSRRQIREAIVQYLYASGPEGIPAPAHESPSLQLVLEPLARKIPVARARAVAHLQQGREQVAGRLQPLVGELATMATRGGSGLQSLPDLFTAEQDLARHLESMRRELNGNREPARLSSLLDDCRTAEDASRSAQAGLDEAASDLPGLENLRTRALSETAALAPYRDRLRAALRDDAGTHPELGALRRAIGSRELARERVEAVVKSLTAHLGDIDRCIAAAVENYSPERLDRVDRAILRLATYEILHDPEIPPAVAMDEAIDLARDFGTTDSPAFVNGILDRIGKTAQPESQPKQ